MKIILLGAPGCGKGTQASMIKQRFSIPHISTGEIFRQNIKDKTPLGLQVKTLMDSGRLCPDDITVALVQERLNQPDCKDGYLLDGFPRNIVQATALDNFLAPDVVLNIKVDFDKIERRITGRRSCPSCGGTYHIDYIDNKHLCPVCGGELVIRVDDTPETVKDRLQVYRSQTEPLIDYYVKQGKVKDIDGDRSVEDVFNQIVKVLD